MRPPRGVFAYAGLLLVAVVANVTACAALDSIQTGQCGNRVLESGEECDTLAPADRFDGGVDGGKGVCGAQSAGAGACRFLCGQPLPDGGKGTSVCPMDEVCGSDEICRPDPLAGLDATAEYQFSQLGPTVTTSARSLVAGDFDGDGLGDVMAITPSGTELFLGSSKGLSLGSTTELAMHGARAARLTADALPIDLRSPYAAPNGGDATDDILFAFGGGISVLTGQAGGTLTPAAYPKVDVPQAFTFAGFVFGNAQDKPPLSTPWLFLPYSAIKGQDHDPTCADTDLAFLYLAGAPTAVKCFPVDANNNLRVVSAAVLAPIHQSPINSCSQFVMGLKGDDHVSVFLPCPDNNTSVFGSWTLGTTVFPIAIGATLDWGPLVYDVDRDGTLDVIAGSKDLMFIAYGTADFHFTSMPNGGGVMDAAGLFDAKVLPWEVVPVPDAFKGPVLAVGDVNRDGRPDFMTARGLYVSTVATAGGTPQFYEAYKIGALADIESAGFGDFNGDGLTDVAFAYDRRGSKYPIGVPELEVLLTSSKQIGDLPLLNPNALTLDSPVFRVVSGDFNGDGLADIAFGQTTDVTLHQDRSQVDTSVDTITVVYGDSGGNFSPVSMGNVQGISSLLPTDILFPREPVYDGLADLGVIFSFSEASDGTHDLHNAAAVLPGQPGHLLVAPLGLLNIDSAHAFHQALPLAVAAGQFDDTDKHLDFGALAVETDQTGAALDALQVWRTSLTGGAIATSSTFTVIDDALSNFAVSASTADPSLVGASATSFPLGSDDQPWFIAAIAGAQRAKLHFGPPVANAGFDIRTIELDAHWDPAIAGPYVRVEAGKIAGKPTIVLLVATELFVVTDFSERSGVTPVSFAGAVTDFTLFPRPARDDSLILLAAGFVELSNGMSAYPVPGITTFDPLAVAVADIDGDRLPDILVASHQGLTAFRLSPDPSEGPTTQVVAQ